ncbi:Astra associated protein 1 Asa1 [Emydomyces testavorans]|uniref:ASTRA-associated protein 1 n=1 Tax=Emydomyces testavorans TaxID=2070801 RepID=A0AAF0DFK7_9EURO|nr:Astra associated protein 1 Asa1 [Emydomyces testavorans]
MSSSESQPAKYPPPTPVYILRGHASPVHALHFYNQNARLVSGDADGWIIVWDMVSKRPTAAWKAHEGAILNVRGVEFAPDDGNLGQERAETENHGGDMLEKRVFTHGRDNALRVWRINTKDEALLDKQLPVEENAAPKDRREPWLIYSITVNTLNFCGFALAFGPPRSHATKPDDCYSEGGGSVQVSSFSERRVHETSSEIFIAVPNALNTGGIDIFHLPSQKRVCMIYAEKSTKTGMVMALEIFFSTTGDLYVVSGYEDGQCMVHRQHGPVVVQEDTDTPSASAWTWNWQRIYTNRAHSQPVLSLDISPTKEYFLTSSADANIVKHPLLGCDGPKSGDHMPLRVVNTKHAGQQGLRIRSDQKICVTAGWDGRARVYSCKTMKELAVLKWHSEGCFAIALGDIQPDEQATSKEVPTAHATKPVVGKDENATLVLRSHPGSLAAIKQQRTHKAQLTHWIAVGSKDGKISLWDIY